MTIPPAWIPINHRTQQRIIDRAPPYGTGQIAVRLDDGREVVYPFACPCPYDHLALYERPDGALVWVEEAA